MAMLARQGSQDINIRNKAVEICQGLRQKDFAGEAKACFEFCRDQIRYIRDILNVETLHYPATILAIGAGDCDDKAILLSSLLASIGHRSRFIAVAMEPDEFCHVWTQVNLGGRWIDLEPTEPVQFGERIPPGSVVQTLTREVD